MKKLLSLLTTFIALSVSVVSANAQDVEDVIYLKNGSVIRGVIIEQVPNETIKLETYDGNVFVYKYDEIAKFARNTPEKEIYKKPNKSTSKGYYGNINIGYGVNLHGISDMIDFQIINGYKFNPYLAIGFGTGLKFDGNWGLALPLFAHVKANFLKSNITPFAALNVGYNINLLSCFYNGFYIEPILGVGFGVSPKTKINLTVSYSANNTQYVLSSYRGSSYGEVMSGTLRFAVGVTF